jgi:aminomethyltransferase
MKQTPFAALHEELGAKMTPFAGYEMPVSYTGINEEHEIVRKAVGVFDVSHMGEFEVKGEGAAQLVQRISSNDIARLVPGKAQYNCMPNEDGGIVDDLIVYKKGEQEYMLVVNAANIEKDWNWIKRHNEFGAQMEDISEQTALLAVQGPKAKDTLQMLTDKDLSAIKFYNFEVGSMAGVNNVVISNTGYTGSGGFELYFDVAHAEKVWRAIFEAGEEYGIQAIGLGARDTLRLEAGLCLYGNDIDDTTSPLEAGLGWITKFVEGNDFVNREALEQQKEAGVENKLVGFKMKARGIPRKDYEILNEDGEKIGRVTSGTMSPLLKQGIGMGYVKKEYAQRGTTIIIKVRNKQLEAEVVKRPFVDLGK